MRSQAFTPHLFLVTRRRQPSLQHGCQACWSSDGSLLSSGALAYAGCRPMSATAFMLQLCAAATPRGSSSNTTHLQGWRSSCSARCSGEGERHELWMRGAHRLTYDVLRHVLNHVQHRSTVHTYMVWGEGEHAPERHHPSTAG